MIVPSTLEEIKVIPPSLPLLTSIAPLPPNVKSSSVKTCNPPALLIVSPVGAIPSISMVLLAAPNAAVLVAMVTASAMMSAVVSLALSVTAPDEVIETVCPPPSTVLICPILNAPASVPIFLTVTSPATPVDPS